MHSQPQWCEALLPCCVSLACLQLGRVVEKSLRVDAALNIIRKVVNDDPSRPYESLVFKMAM